MNLVNDFDTSLIQKTPGSPYSTVGTLVTEMSYFYLCADFDIQIEGGEKYVVRTSKIVC